MAEERQVLRETDGEARRLAKGLVRLARHGALATLDPATGAPMASRVAVATDSDGAPVILVSALSAHTPALLADPRASLLLGEPGKGDPLAHPRVTLAVTAERLARDSEAGRRVRRRFLSRHPKSALYADFGDFAFFRLDPAGASLNGGFGKAFSLGRADLLCDPAAAAALSAIEEGALAHMAEDHAEAVALYARALAGEGPGDWSMTGLDPEGFDLMAGDRAARVWFDTPLSGAADLRAALAALAARARGAAPG